MTNRGFENPLSPGALPPFPGGVDPNALEFLRGTRWEEVPDAEAFVATCSTWRRTITTEGATPELMAEIHTAFTEREQTHPNTHAWDALRSYMANHLVANHTEDSLDLVYGMRSFHIMVDTIRTLGSQLDEQTGEAMAISFMRRFTIDPDSSRLYRFNQAYCDILIREDPDSPEIDNLETALSELEPG
ncbi:MAG TPA: hypothetical protein VFB59_01575 [Candidatus Saccharimonadales bacterium]|nr:hypothetical protein [Candidatus Saccharimonadales bacterium]